MSKSFIVSLFFIFSSSHLFANQETLEPITRTGPAALPWDKLSAESAVEASLDRIFKSIENNFPLTEVAAKQIEIAEGRERVAQGAFDFRIQMQAGFLAETYEQQILDGALTKQIPGTPVELYGGWRRGQGNFRPYEGRSLTGADGEYRAGVKVPLLRDLISDPSRTRLATSKLLRDAEKETAKFRILDLKRIASDRYWEWIGAYLKLEATLKLYRLADERLSQVKRRVNAGGSARIDVIEIERMIAQRKAQLIEAERYYQKSALELSLYYRDKLGKPQNSIRISKNFDLNATISGDRVESEKDSAVEEDALNARADLKAIEKQLEAADKEVKLSKSQILPRLDAQLEYAVDKGSPKKRRKRV